MCCEKNKNELLQTKHKQVYWCNSYVLEAFFAYGKQSHEIGPRSANHPGTLILLKYATQHIIHVQLFVNWSTVTQFDLD